MENALDILNELDATKLRDRLAALEAEKKAVKVLLRAASRLEKQRPIQLSRGDASREGTR
jgi:hypothetical protein